jgi:UDP-glucose:(heptosyl)LPS alpha-1,3-glucosyltransferase
MRDRILMIPNGVDTNKFQPEPAPEDGGDGAVKAIFVGSEWERKGLQFAIEALEFAPEASLTVVGEGDEEGYLEIARRINADDRVTFAGQSTDVASWYGAADVFLLPTAYETFSLVSYEAAASGLALLVTRVNGVEDLLRDGVNGWFVERDARKIAARLRALAADPAQREAMGSAARSESLKHSWSSVVSSYEALYAEVAA